MFFNGKGAVRMHWKQVGAVQGSEAAWMGAIRAVR